ncbi:MAG: hypothetical protein JSV89_14405 [Spirochaetaceae bacterium]|nr:MAG: hypothetical protein JSV89_14405 [Spirochaetaceae bacterium]
MAATDITGQSLGRSICLILRKGRLLARGIDIFKASLREFFLPQFQSSLRLHNRPVAVLSHPLDGSLPFVPSLVRRYLGYLSIWLKTLLFLYRTYGEAALRDIERMMTDLVLLYNTSGRVYQRCQSTTPSRRTPLGNPYFFLILLFDPHLHCIPSLHVLTVCYNYRQIRKMVMKFDPQGANNSEAVEQAYRLAVEITETILLVKQHSLLDIGPSLYLLSRLFPDYDDAEVYRFVADLFADNPMVGPERALPIRELILEEYEKIKVDESRRQEQEPIHALLRYLEGYLKISLSIG